MTFRSLELVHIDVSSPDEPSFEHLRYTVAFLGDCTAKSDVYLLKYRAELFESLFGYRARSENKLKEQGYRLTNNRLDRAGENLSTALQEFCRNYGIGLKPSSAYAKQNNGVTKR